MGLVRFDNQLTTNQRLDMFLRLTHDDNLGGEIDKENDAIFLTVDFCEVKKCY